MLVLSEEQLAAVAHFKGHGITVVNGSPGSGKTTLIRNLQIEGEKMLLCSPTGCAAARISKATGLDAYVIAKIEYDKPILLEYRGCNLVVDESSMLSVNDARRLLSFLAPKRICFIGDAKQLPCIDGTPLLNTLLQAEEIPKVFLKMNHRQLDLASGLVKTLNLLGTPEFKAPIQDANFIIYPSSNNDEAIARAVKLFLSLPDAQMLALTNATRDKLNLDTDASPIRRVMCTENLYLGDSSVLAVANGVTGDLMSIALTNRVTKVVTHTTMVLYSNGFEDVMSKGKYSTKFVPARCITVHKSQGNEFDVPGIIVLTSWKDEMPLELIYTALSRFKGSVKVFGTPTIISKAFYGKFDLDHVNKEVVKEMRKRQRVD